MYRKHAGLMQFEQELGSLGRNEISDLEDKLNRLYHESQNPTTALAVLTRNGIYNTDLLEQRLELVQEKKQFLNEKFKIHDQITFEKNDLLDRSQFLNFARNLSGTGAVAMCGLYGLFPDPVNIFALCTGMLFGVITALASGVNLYNNITTKAELKQLRKSPEYIALQQSEEKDKLLEKEKTETNQLPFPNCIALPQGMK